MSRQLDLVLVNPAGRTRQYQSLAATMAAIEPPIWAGMMANFVRTHGFSCAILDANAEELSSGAAADRIVEMSPLLTAVVAYGHNPSASTQVMPAAGALCVELKKRDPDGKILLLGGHVAALPKRTLEEEATDFVAGGEGLYTLLDLLHALEAGADLGKVRDLWYREAGEIRVGPAATLLNDLDDRMPGVAWDLLPMSRYRAHNWHGFGDLRRQPYGAFYTTLGCPYRCAFCCIQAPFKRGEKASGLKEGVNSYRFWSPESVIREIDTLVQRYGVRNIKLADEMFVLNPRHVHAICDLIIERGYDLNIWAYARVDTVRDDATLERLQRAGFRWLAFGVEAGSARVRDAVAKGFDQEDIFRGLERVRAAGIHIGANYIFGLPEDDLVSMRATLDLALNLNCEWANFSCTMAYPGSRLYRQALTEGWPLPPKWSGYSQYAEDALPLRTKHTSAADVLQFRDRAFQRYFTDRAYLDMITRTFGQRTTEHIRDMVSFRLVRHLGETEWGASPIAGVSGDDAPGAMSPAGSRQVESHAEQY